MDSKNEFELAIVNEKSMFELLRFDCTCKLSKTRNQVYNNHRIKSIRLSVSIKENHAMLPMLYRVPCIHFYLSLFVPHLSFFVCLVKTLFRRLWHFFSVFAYFGVFLHVNHSHRIGEVLLFAPKFSYSESRVQSTGWWKSPAFRRYLRIYTYPCCLLIQYISKCPFSFKFRSTGCTLDAVCANGQPTLSP